MADPNGFDYFDRNGEPFGLILKGSATTGFDYFDRNGEPISLDAEVAAVGGGGGTPNAGRRTLLGVGT